MGKIEERQLQQQHILESGSERFSAIFCECSSKGLVRIGRAFNLKCFLVLILSVSAFLSVLFWLPPFHSSIRHDYDASDEVTLNATVQAGFRLPKPVSLLVGHIGRLEYDIFGEIGMPNTTVSILSMHQSGTSNWTDVVFCVLPVPQNVPINPVSLSILRASLIELVLRQSNLSLTISVFGRPSFFEILKFPGGITVIPVQPASIWLTGHTLFNFMLYNSVAQIQENFDEFKSQLKFGLRLRYSENVYVQVTNTYGSTMAPPVTVQASVLSDIGNHNLLPWRLKQLAQTITGSSPAKNLGLDHSVFGKVKEVHLSSYLNNTLDTSYGSPSPSPSPSPSISPSPSPSYASSPSSDHGHISPCSYCDTSSPSPSPSLFPKRGPCLSSTISPNPSSSNFPPYAAPPYNPFLVSKPHLAPDLSPSPAKSYGSSPDERSGKASIPLSQTTSLISPSPSSFVTDPSYKKLWFLGVLGPLIFHLLCGLS